MMTKWTTDYINLSSKEKMVTILLLALAFPAQCSGLVEAWRKKLWENPHELKIVPKMTDTTGYEMQSHAARPHFLL
jgi:hypothetical protein